jgi:hypothetical protein
MTKRNKLSDIVCTIKEKEKEKEKEKGSEFTLFENDVHSIFIPLHKVVLSLLHCVC